MIRISTLGPKNTFSDLASRKFCNSIEADCSIEYTKTILHVFEEVQNGRAEYGIVPIENMSEGYVQPTLDGLFTQNLTICKELTLSVQFGFIANEKDTTKLEKIFVQPVAMGQCSEFIATLGDVEVINTNSNIESLQLLLRNNSTKAGAIIPSHVLKHNADMALLIPNVSNYKNNRTRFIAISKRQRTEEELQKPKTSILILDDSDHSGILSSIASAFASRNINLTSIISRPTKEAIGKYHFFIEIEGTYKDPAIADAITEINAKFSCRVLGSFQST